MTTRRDIEGPFPGGFKSLAPMFNTQLLCIVGSLPAGPYPSNKVFVWDDSSGETRGEIHFRSEVKSVLLRRDKLVIILEKTVIPTQTYIYILSSLKPIETIPTIDNPHGIGAITYHKDVFIIATLDTQHGHIRVEDVYNTQIKRKQIHENPISCITVDTTGKMAASASEQGTIIRVFDCVSMDMLCELRRGTRPARVSSIAFSPDLSYVIAASDHSTVHVWRL